MTRRRFVAGAVCPKCAAVDRIVLEDEDRRRRCVACGFTDEMPTSRPSPTPRGRLDAGRRPASGTVDSVVRVVPIRPAAARRTPEDDTSSG